MRRFHIFLKGKVQGIGLRYHVRKKAESLGLTGWVRNLDNGSVEINAEGGDESIKEFLAWLEKGVPEADVEKITAKEEKPKKEQGSFEIVY
ncbi:MAG: acylphosphatase [Candidatus Woesearchaeota archaeon]